MDSKYDIDEWRWPSDDDASKWGGWEWATDNHVYRTNEYGQGLWELRDDRFAQIMGTSQFSLPRNRARALAKLKSWDLMPRERRAEKA